MWAVLTKNAACEEYFPDAFALMNNYSEDYVDTAVDYWYNDDIADRYSPAEYIKDMDAGGNRSVLDNIGLGNEYSLSRELKTKIKYSKKGLLLPKNEYAKFKSSANTDYHKGNKSHVGLQYQSCVGDKTHILYVYEDRGFDNYNVLARIDYADEDAANIVAEVIDNERVNGITALVNRVLQIFEAGQSGYTVYNADSKKRSGSRGNDSLFERKANSNARRIDGKSGIVSRNKRGVKYSLNVYDSDAGIAATERLRNHVGDKIGVTYGDGDEEIRTTVSASNVAIVTEQADGQRVGLNAKADELSYTENGFVYTGGSGTVTYHFIWEDADKTNGDLAQTKYPHLYDEDKVSKEYLDSVNPEIENAVISIRSGDADSVPDVIEVVTLSEDAVRAISNFVGFDVSGYACKIERDRLMHIENRHGINGEHDHSLSDPKDIARMGFVINNSDSIDWGVDGKGRKIFDNQHNDKHNKPSPVIMMNSKIDGTYCVSQVVPDSRKRTLWITSARIQKAAVGSQVPNAVTSPRLQTSETPLDSSSASDDIVSQSGDIVNRTWAVLTEKIWPMKTNQKSKKH